MYNCIAFGNYKAFTKRLATLARHQPLSVGRGSTARHQWGNACLYSTHPCCCSLWCLPNHSTLHTAKTTWMLQRQWHTTH